MVFFFDRLFFVFAAPGFFLLGCFGAFATFFGGFGGGGFLFGLLFFVVFGFEAVDDPAQRTELHALGGRRGFRAFTAFGAFTAAAAGERGSAGSEHNGDEQHVLWHMNSSARALARLREG